MYILVTYDVSTQSKKGRNRLRKVAQTCQDYGQRVQWSCFECSVTDVQLEQLRARLRAIIEDDEDSLRIYRLGNNRDSCIESYGKDGYQSFDDPLIL